MLSKTLKQLNLQPSVEYIDLYSFIKYIECFRLRDKLSIKEFYRKNKKQLNLFYFSAGAGLSQSTPALLESLGIKDYENAYKNIDRITDTLFKYVVNLGDSNYFSIYCEQAKNGNLDKLI